STSRLEEIANRIATLERLFNLEAGMRPEEDTLPERFSSETIQVEGKDKSISKKTMDTMKRDYYRVRGWDNQGKPPRFLLNALKISRRKK
ncbi:MAG: aldehyde ferredoxin oxidoreductase C-terminal domain-containing protein, partial [Candidatus Aminicenantes bacterium]|nr:aldehyde ferredoxin oxidoreductase C-terminal domain-containing protein [Candidatus Aminicenantes bacterium]